MDDDNIVTTTTQQQNKNWRRESERLQKRERRKKKNRVVGWMDGLEVETRESRLGLTEVTEPSNPQKTEVFFRSKTHLAPSESVTVTLSL